VAEIEGGEFFTMRGGEFLDSCHDLAEVEAMRETAIVEFIFFLRTTGDEKVGVYHVMD
jgi:hypothetical protein